MRNFQSEPSIEKCLFPDRGIGKATTTTTTNLQLRERRISSSELKVYTVVFCSIKLWFAISRIVIDIDTEIKPKSLSIPAYFVIIIVIIILSLFLLLFFDDTVSKVFLDAEAEFKIR